MSLPSLFLSLVLLTLLLRPTHAINSSWYHKFFHGDGTYYGRTTSGHCNLDGPVPSIYQGMIPVAINRPQYGGSAACGMCLEGTGSGQGATRRIRAYVSNECPECKFGDLDLARDGDGRWNVRWKAVPCPREDLTFKFQGSNPWYLKVQPRGLKSPATQLWIQGRKANRVPDNFFVIQNGAQFKFPVRVRVTTVLGCTLEATLRGYNGIVRPTGLQKRGSC